jgi:DNA polymerase alpha subunit A
MEGGKSRRQVVVEGRGGKKVKNALAELAELRKSGGKRANTFELKEEEAVYDEVDDDEYARIVQKRREEGGALTIFPTVPHSPQNQRRVMI